MASVKSGYNAKFVVGGTSMLQATDIRLEINHEAIDITDLASTYRERTGGILDWRATCTSNYATQQALTKAAAGGTSGVLTIRDGSGAVVFIGAGFVTRGTINFPTGASNQEIEVVGNGSTPSIS